MLKIIFSQKILLCMLYLLKFKNFENFEKYNFLQSDFFNNPSYSKCYADSNAKNCFWFELISYILRYSIFTIRRKKYWNDKNFLILFNIFLNLLTFTSTLTYCTVKKKLWTYYTWTYYSWTYYLTPTFILYKIKLFYYFHVHVKVTVTVRHDSGTESKVLL